MRVQEEDRGGEQENKILQLNDAVADLLQVLLPLAMRSDNRLDGWHLQACSVPRSTTAI